MEVNPHDNVEKLINQAADIVEMPSHQIRLIFKGKQLDESKTLADSNIMEGSNIHVILRLRGGGCQFTDLEKSPVTIQFSDVAPNWRTCTSGLNLEGFCRNPFCKAFNNQVTIQIGFGKFDMHNEDMKLRSVCPECCQFVKAITCGFSKCYWKYSGMRSFRNDHVSSKYQAVGNHYILFSSQQQDIAEWDYLIITAVKSREETEMSNEIKPLETKILI